MSISSSRAFMYPVFIASPTPLFCSCFIKISLLVNLSLIDSTSLTVLSSLLSSTIIILSTKSGIVVIVFDINFSSL
jgi:hypothetical protein